MCPGQETNGEFAGESGNLHREWWRVENLHFSLILQVAENQRSKQGNKKAERCVRPAKRQKKWWPDPESNWGHGDFQSPALPTELSCHLCGRLRLSHPRRPINRHQKFCFSSSNTEILTLFSRFFPNNHRNPVRNHRHFRRSTMPLQCPPKCRVKMRHTLHVHGTNHLRHTVVRHHDHPVAAPYPGQNLTVP